MGSFLPGTISEKEKDKDDQDYQRANDQERVGCRDQLLILPTPGDVITGRELELRRDHPLGILDEGRQGTVVDIGLHEDAHIAILARDHCRSRCQVKIRHLREGNALPLHGSHKNLFQ